MRLKDILLKFIQLEHLISTKANERHTHEEYYTKSEIDAMLMNVLEYDVLPTSVSNKKSSC